LSSVWENYPADLILKQILVPGGAFRASHGSQHSKNRFLFILNVTPVQDAVLMVATSTTQFEHNRSKWPSTVLVDIAPCDYASLKEPSLINCEFIEKWDKQRDLIEKINAQRVQPLEPLPENVLTRIRDAVRQCRRLSSFEKRMILGDES